MADNDETMSAGSAADAETGAPADTAMQVDDTEAGAEEQEATSSPATTAAAPEKPVCQDPRLLFCAEVLIGYKCEVQVGHQQPLTLHLACSSCACGWTNPAPNPHCLCCARTPPPPNTCSSWMEPCMRASSTP